MRHIAHPIHRLLGLVLSLGVLAGCGAVGLPGGPGRETVGQPTLPALSLVIPALTAVSFALLDIAPFVS